MLATPKDPAIVGRCSQQPFFEMLSKEHEYMLKRSAALFKPSNFMRHPYSSIHDLMPAPKASASTQPSSRHHHSNVPTTDRPSRTSTIYADDYALGASSSSVGQRSSSSPVVVDDAVDLHQVDDDEEERHRRQDGQLSKRAGNSMYKDQIRFNPMASTAAGNSGCGGDSNSTSYSRSSPKEKSPSSSSASSSPLLLRPLPESALLQECLIEEETKCVVCNATFPSVWLLEQHAALQHANLGALEEKPFICDQCGQSYRYRSAYVKHREQNHRARLPADKLFTCDVCGMQFRYLKSFKKHRLNHALERLHGKNERRAMEYGGSELLVTSSNETGELGDEHHQFAIKAEVVDEEDDQDDTVDSLSAVGLCMELQQKALPDGMDATMQATVDDMNHGRISSSAENLAQDPCGSNRQMAGNASAGMNNNMDSRNFILKVRYYGQRIHLFMGC